MDDAGYKVRLISVASFYNAIASSQFEQVIFKVTPTISESRRVEYTPVSPVHMPGSIQVYKNTASRDFTIGATLISRTPTEALENMVNLQLLRAWCTPYFGSSTTLATEQSDFRKSLPNLDQQTQDMVNKSIKDQNIGTQVRGIELLGAPPDVLYLYAYSTNDQRQTVNQVAVNLHKIPVVMTGLDITYPADVDYIPSSDELPSPFPTKMEISVNLAETHSPSEYQKFNLSDFKSGRLVNF